jgi:hypothetical protein
MHQHRCLECEWCTEGPNAAQEVEDHQERTGHTVESVRDDVIEDAAEEEGGFVPVPAGYCYACGTAPGLPADLEWANHEQELAERGLRGHDTYHRTEPPLCIQNNLVAPLDPAVELRSHLMGAFCDLFPDAADPHPDMRPRIAKVLSRWMSTHLSVTPV